MYLKTFQLPVVMVTVLSQTMPNMYVQQMATRTASYPSCQLTEREPTQIHIDVAAHRAAETCM
jgi:hypothetical protein